MNDTIKKLNTLGMIFFVLAALCIPVSFITPVILWKASSAASEGRLVLMCGAGAGLIGSLLLVVCIALVGHTIRSHRWWTFCFVVSILLCPSFPFGTALGIFSLITLNKPEVKTLFTPNHTSDGIRQPADGLPIQSRQTLSLNDERETTIS
jgi:hypothetical protein